MAPEVSIQATKQKFRRSVLIAGLLLTPLGLVGCNSTDNVLTHGYQLSEETLALVPEGSSREQVLLSLGTPSTTLTRNDGGETFYYISLKKTRPVAFARPRVVDQRVLALYLSEENTVQQIANYGLKDGKVFDFVGRVTPTGGKDLSFIGQLLASGAGAAGAINPFGRR